MKEINYFNFVWFSWLKRYILKEMIEFLAFLFVITKYMKRGTTIFKKFVKFSIYFIMLVNIFSKCVYCSLIKIYLISINLIYLQFKWVSTQTTTPMNIAPLMRSIKSKKLLICSIEISEEPSIQDVLYS